MTDPTSLPSFITGSSAGPSGSNPPGSSAGPGTQHQLRGLVVDALLDAGVEPFIDEDGDVAVRMQDQMLFVRCIDSQPPLMRVFGQWLLDDSVGGDELVRLRAANVVTAAVNLVKVSVDGDRLSVAVDLVIGPGLDLGPLLGATIEAVLGSVRTWHQVATQLMEGE